MILMACATLDKKIGAYMLPQFFRTRGEAMRAFIDACGSPESPFARHSEDYVFCCVGSYDDAEGKFLTITPPDVLMSAVDALLVK